MSCETIKHRIPVVDLSGGKVLKPGGSDSWKSASDQVREALEEYGCLELIYTKPCMEFHNTIIDSVEQVLKLPYEIKMKNTNPKPAHGYMPKISIHEGMGIVCPNNQQECQDFTQLMWPQGNQHFCESVHSFAKLVAEVQELLVKMLCESYGIEKEYSESMTYLLVLLKYIRSKGDTNVGLKGHTDKTFFSILHQNHVNGLQIRTKDEQWVSYQPSSHSSFAIIVGDGCMAWSNDRIKSCYHRVMVEGEEARYTVGLFTFMKGLIKAPKELVDEEHPLKYKPFEHQGLVDFYMSCHNDQNKDDINMLKAYCGI